MKKFNIFLSYSHEDKEIVGPIFSILKLASEKIFLDQKVIKPGDEWEVVLASALENMKTLILFWCAHSSASDNVRKEYSYALANSKKIVPVLLDDTPVPNNISQFQWIDYSKMLHPFHDNRDFYLNPKFNIPGPEDHYHAGSKYTAPLNNYLYLLSHKQFMKEIQTMAKLVFEE